MNINYENYRAEQILSSYEFIFSQWIGGKLTSKKINEDVLTVEIFEKNLIELRKEYFAKKDSSVELINKTEKSIIDKLSIVMNISEQSLREIAEEMLIQAEQTLKDIINS